MIHHPTPRVSYSFAPGTMFARIFHASPVAMTITTVDDNRYIDVNAAYANLVGVRRDALIGHSNLEYTPIRALDTPANTDEKVGARQLIEHQCHLRTGQGELRHVITSTHAQVWQGREYLFTILRDLTDLDRAEDALRAMEMRSRLLFENVPLPVFVYDLETLNIIGCNAAALEQYGYSRDEMLNLNMLEVHSLEDRLKFIDHVPTMPAEIQLFGVWRHQRKDGTIMDMEVTGYALELDGRSTRIAVCQDVTEELAIQAALEASQERYRIIAEVTNDVIWEVDAESETITFSDGMSTVFGHEVPPVVPLEWWVNNLHPDERKTAGDSFMAALAGTNEEWNANYRFRQGNGQYAHVFDRGYIFRDETGRATRIIGAMIDITPQVELHEAATRAAIEERRRLARDLHDSVTQSLYSLSLLSETARRTAEHGDHKATHDYLNRLGELAQQCLKEMRLLVHEMSPSVLEKEGLAGALQARLDAVERHSGIRAQLVVDMKQKLSPQVQLQYYRVAEEALNNALKHAAATTVRVHIHADENTVAMEIDDNGKGFDLQATASSGGMGLIGMRERIENLGGHLSIDTSPGKGTVIRVHISNGNGNNE